MSDDSANDDVSASSWLDDGESWPGGRLRADAPVWARHALAMARNVWALHAERMCHPGDLAATAAVPVDHVNALLGGDGKVPTFTVAQLEAATGSTLWPTPQEMAQAVDERVASAAPIVSPPRFWMSSGESWPNGLLRRDAPAAAFYSILFSRNLFRAMRAGRWEPGRLIFEAAISGADLYAALTGSGPVSTYAIGQLEELIGHSLWPTAEAVGRERVRRRPG